MEPQKHTQTRTCPEGYHTVTTCLMARGAGKLADFLKKAFNATEISRMNWPDGTIAHAELKIGDSMIMLAEAMEPDKNFVSSIFLYVDNCDEVYQRAIKNGATMNMSPANMFWGDRFSSVQDPFGNQWQIATHIEDVPQEEMRRRGEEWMKEQFKKR